MTSALINRWYHTTLKNEIEKVKTNRMIEARDESAVLILADSWSGHSAKTQMTELKRIGARLLRIPPKTTDKLQPLDVNFNRQLKIFYNRIVEKAFYQDSLKNVTSRAGIVNLQSLIHNQLTSPKYRDMIRYAWHHTDPSFNISELENYPPKMVTAIQFDVDDRQKCAKRGCENYAFLKCSHCGKPMCLHHFLERECFHGVARPRRDLADTCPGDSSDGDDTCGHDEGDANDAFEGVEFKPEMKDRLPKNIRVGRKTNRT